MSAQSFASANGSSYAYPVTFVALGLPNGTAWTITLPSGQNVTDNSSSITALETNGSYIFTISNLKEFYPVNSTVEVTVNGSSVVRNVVFLNFALVEGTMTPQNATVWIGGIGVVNVTNGSFKVHLRAGTYLIAASLNGYVTFSRTFTLNQSQLADFTINLHRPNSTPNQNGIGYYAFLLRVAGFTALLFVVIAAIAYLASKRGR